MVSVLTVVAGLTAVYLVALVWVARSESERFQQVGPLIMVRTQAGKKLIDRIAKQKWWSWVSDIFIVLTVLAGLAMIVLVVWQNTLLFTHSEQVAENPPQVEQTLAIPGINPAIPVGYGLFALVLALVIHEGGHGVMARYAHMKVKSLGLLFFVIPIGAFVEPDEAALQGATLRDKLRMFASGPGPNMVLGAICVVLFSQVMIPAMAPAHDGVALMGVDDGLPAGESGLEAGMFVTAIDGNETGNYTQFTDALDEEYPDASWSYNRTQGQGSNESSATPAREVTFNVSWWRNGETGTVTVEPVDKYVWYQQNRPAVANESFKNQPFLGVNPADGDRLNGILANLESPLEEQGIRGMLFYLALPFVNLQPFPATFHDIFQIGGLFAGWGAAFWVTANSLYWLFWINVVLGTFNALPMGPLDGGHMFRHSLHTWLRRKRGIRDSDLRVFQADGGSPTYVGRTDAVQAELDEVDHSVKIWNRVLGFGLLFLVVAPLIIPQFL